ncbi:MAG: hypothetical protein BGO09_03475 [Bacteroidetes bacterium 47-18]|nr:MAG: hypothetical protein BGO09_03475 [Bacteroidetes bacterium 47-18]
MEITKKELTSEELLVNKTFWILCAISKLSDDFWNISTPKEIIDWCKENNCRIEISEDDVHDIFKMADLKSSHMIKLRFVNVDYKIERFSHLTGNRNVIGYGHIFKD